MFGFQMTLRAFKSKGIYDLKLKLTHKRYFINSLTCSDLYGITLSDYDMLINQRSATLSLKMII